jgi:hypothetical protein
MHENRDAPPTEIDSLRDHFLNCLRIAHAVFGEHTFRIRDKKKKWRHSQPLFDAVMVSTEELAQCENKLIANKHKILDSLSKAMEKQEVYEIIVGRPNTANAIKQRVSIVSDLMKQFC